LILGAGLRGLAGAFAAMGSAGTASGAGETAGAAAGSGVSLAGAGDFLRPVPAPFCFAGGGAGSGWSETGAGGKGADGSGFDAGTGPGPEADLFAAGAAAGFDADEDDFEEGPGFLGMGQDKLFGRTGKASHDWRNAWTTTMRLPTWLCEGPRCDSLCRMLTPDDFTYALENTRVLLAPARRLDTFGTSLVNYFLVTEEMDAVNFSRVREGSIHAERPQILTPQNMAKLLLEGFGEQGERFAEQISAQAGKFAFLKYGFRMSKSDIRSYDVHDSLENVAGKLKDEIAGRNEPLTALLTGVDDGWEVCLLKFMVDLINASAPGNLGDFRERGML
jgi:hypothetical protein